MALSDSYGLPLSVAIASGARHDVVLTERTLDAAFVDELPGKLIGDKAWDSKPLEEELAEERNIELIAPMRGGKVPSRRRQDGRPFRRYKRRWLVERLFAWLKQFRRIALRWERKAENCLGLLHLGCTVIMLRRLFPRRKESYLRQRETSILQPALSDAPVPRR
jgi:IS5 family transposase